MNFDRMFSLDQAAYLCGLKPQSILELGLPTCPGYLPGFIPVGPLGSYSAPQVFGLISLVELRTKGWRPRIMATAANWFAKQDPNDLAGMFARGDRFIVARQMADRKAPESDLESVRMLLTVEEMVAQTRDFKLTGDPELSLGISDAVVAWHGFVGRVGEMQGDDRPPSHSLN